MNDATQIKKDHFRVKIATARDRLNMSHSQMARYLGVPVITAQHWETGRRKPSACAIRLLEVLETVESMAPDLHATLIPLPEVKVSKMSDKPRKAPFDAAHQHEKFPAWMLAGKPGESTGPGIE